MQKIDILDRLSDKSIQLLRGLNPDLSEIKQVKAGDVISIISKESEEIAQVLRELKVSFKSKKKIDIADWIINAYSEAYVTDSKTVEVQHLLLSLLLGIDVQKYYLAKRKISLNVQTSRQGYLTKYVEDFTEIAKKSKTSILHGRSKELIHLMVNLSTKGGKPTLLIGGSGSGKTTLMKELARKIIENDVPEALIGSRILGIPLFKVLFSIGRELTRPENFIQKVLDPISSSEKLFSIILRASSFINVVFPDPEPPINKVGLPPLVERLTIRCINSFDLPCKIDVFDFFAISVKSSTYLAK